MMRLVILNDSEIPETRNVALLRPDSAETSPSGYEWTYVCECDGEPWVKQWWPVTHIEHVRDVAEFGVEPHLVCGDGHVALRMVMPPTEESAEKYVPESDRFQRSRDCPVRAAILRDLMMFFAQAREPENVEEKTDV